jgi:hypothetical protein
MLFLETQNIFNLLITQRRLPLSHLPRDLRIGTHILQQLRRRHRRRDAIIRRIEHLEAQPIFLHAKVANLAQIPRVDITPRVPLPARGVAHVLGEVPRVLVRLDHVADAQRVDVGAEAPREAAGYALAAQLGDGVGVHGVDVDGLFKREGGVGQVALPETDFVGRFARGDYYFLDAEFACGFDDVVGGSGVAAVALIVLGKC